MHSLTLIINKPSTLPAESPLMLTKTVASQLAFADISQHHDAPRCCPPSLQIPNVFLAMPSLQAPLCPDSSTAITACRVTLLNMVRAINLSQALRSFHGRNQGSSLPARVLRNFRPLSTARACNQCPQIQGGFAPVSPAFAG